MGIRDSSHPPVHHHQWPAQSKQPASRPVERHLASSSLPRLPARPHLRLVVSRSLTVTALVPSPCARSVATRSRPSCSSPSCPSSRRPSWLFRSLPRPTLSRSSRTRTWLPSTPSASRSSPRTSSSPAASVVSATKRAPSLKAHASTLARVALTLRLSNHDLLFRNSLLL